MIGQPSWFKIRKFGGWGLTPVTKEGWFYTGAIILPFVVFQSLPYWSEQVRFYVTLGWLSVILIDVLDIMFRLKKDEREYIHEAIAERNVAWFLIASLLIGFLYKTLSAGLSETPSVDLFLLIPLLGAALVKTLTHLYLRDK